MKLNRIKIGILMAALLGLAVFALPIFAACPLGTYDLGVAANYGPAVALPVADGTGANPAGTLQLDGTYCVPATGIQLGAGAIPVAVTTLIVSRNGQTIVGEVTGARLTTNNAVGILVNIGIQDVTLQNFDIFSSGGAADDAIVCNGNARIQGMTFNDGAGAFATAAIQLAGNDCIVKNNTFNLTIGAVPAIQLTLGIGAQVYDNQVIGALAVPAPTFFIENASAASYNTLSAWNNTINFAGQLVGGANGYTNSVIRDNIAGQLRTNGIDLAGDSNNTQVLRNIFTYAQAAGGIGILDAGGSNNQYRDNQVTGGGTGGDAIQFGSSNAIISGNQLDATTAGDAIDAATSGATNATITDNSVLGAAANGILMNVGANSNFTVTGNTFNNLGAAGIANAGGGTNHMISTNTFVSVGGAGITSAGNNTISNNEFTGVNGGNGIGTGVNDQVIGNKITAVTLGDGINVAGGNVLVKDNTVKSVSGGFDGIDLTVANCEVTGNTVDTVTGGGAGILFGGGNQIVKNNTIKNILTGGIGMDVVNFNNNEILNNTIFSVSQDGILVNGGDNNNIVGNTVENAAKDAVNVAASRFAAIRLDDIGGANAGADNNVVDGNTVINAGSSTYAVGIDVLDSSGAGTVPDNCDIINNTVKDFTTVTGDSTDVAVGIRMLAGTNNTLVGNTVTNTGNLRVGIDITTPNETPVKNNTIEGMIDVGLRLRGGTINNPLEVKGNILTGNVTGISMESGAADITNVNKVYGGATALLVTTLGNADTFDLHGNCFDAPILARNDGLGMLDATDNGWGVEPVKGVNVFGDVDFTGWTLCGTVPGKSHIYGAAAGWYMVSVPLNSGTPSALFGTVAYRWNCATEVYDIVSMVEPEFGYWVSLPASKSVTDSGSQVTSDVTINISCTGWHQVSAPWSYPKSAIKVIKGAQEKTWADAATAGWVRDDIYAYSATGTDYTMPSTINPWYGYWVRANVSGLSLKLLYASGTPVSASFAPMGPKALVVPADLPPMPPSPSVGADDLEFGNYPNPIVDVHTTTFAVKGAGAAFVDAVKVEIYDLAGRLVYEAEEAGTSLDWHTDSDYGEYLANGVYLYKLYALVNGEWVVSETKKLAILR